MHDSSVTDRTYVNAARLHTVQVREVYMAACEAEPPAELPDVDVLTLALEFAAVERDLQEIDRARCVCLLPCLRCTCLPIIAAACGCAGL